MGSLVPALPGTRALFNLKTSNIGHIGTNFTIELLVETRLMDEIKYLTHSDFQFKYLPIYRYIPVSLLVL